MIPLNRRWAIVLLRLEGKGIREIARRLRHSRRTVRRVLRYYAESAMVPQAASSRPSAKRLKEEDLVFLKALVEANPLATLTELLGELT